jgi:hypothetical protein
MVHAVFQIMISNRTLSLTAVLMMPVAVLMAVVLVRLNAEMDAVEDVGDIEFALEVSLNSLISLDILQVISLIKRESHTKP